MRSSIVKAYALGLITGAFMTAGIINAIPAKASPDDEAVGYAVLNGDAVCSVLDDYPTFDGIIGIGAAIVEDGLSWRQAGQVIGLSALEICPRHLPLVMDFANQANRQVA